MPLQWHLVVRQAQQFHAKLSHTTCPMAHVCWFKICANVNICKCYSNTALFRFHLNISPFFWCFFLLFYYIYAKTTADIIFCFQNSFKNCKSQRELAAKASYPNIPSTHFSPRLFTEMLLFFAVSVLRSFDVSRYSCLRNRGIYCIRFLHCPGLVACTSKLNSTFQQIYSKWIENKINANHKLSIILVCGELQMESQTMPSKQYRFVSSMVMECLFFCLFVVLAASRWTTMRWTHSVCAHTQSVSFSIGWFVRSIALSFRFINKNRLNGDKRN